MLLLLLFITYHPQAVWVSKQKASCANIEATTLRVQNLAEAEYVVALFMYMRLIGYSAESISILTTYNGQKHLIRDVIKQRCADNPFIGKPHKVSGFHVWLICRLWYLILFWKASFADVYVLFVCLNPWNAAFDFLLFE